MLFRARQECQRMDGCGETWSNSGVGAMGGNDDSEIYWCCTNDAIQQGLCDATKVGRLIINDQLFARGVTAHQLELPIPKSGVMTELMGDAHGIFQMDGSGTYILLAANCNENGRPVQMVGNWSWSSIDAQDDDDICGDDQTNVEKQSAEITDLTLEPKSYQVTFFERHLPKRGMINLGDLRLRNYDDEIPPTTVESLVNIVAFRLDSACDSAGACSNGEDWNELGIGVRRQSDETYQYCCTEQNILEGLCEASHRDELIYNLNKTVDDECGFFMSRDWLVPVPRQGWVSIPIESTENDNNFAEGRYIILMANCNPNGRPMDLRGKIEWNSYQGDSDNGPLTPVDVISSATGINEVTEEPEQVDSPPTSAPLPTDPPNPPVEAPTDPPRVPPPNDKPDVPPDDLTPTEATPSEPSTPAEAPPTLAPIFPKATKENKSSDTHKRTAGQKFLLVLVVILFLVVFALSFRQYKMAKSQVRLRKHIWSMEALEDLHDAHVDWAVDATPGQPQYRDNPQSNGGTTSSQIEMTRHVSWADETAVNPSRRPPPTPPTGAFPPRIDSDTGQTIRLTEADLC